eukprot:142574-Alexandrium_andersonii.AAC.1
MTFMQLSNVLWCSGVDQGEKPTQDGRARAATLVTHCRQVGVVHWYTRVRTSQSDIARVEGG